MIRFGIILMLALLWACNSGEEKVKPDLAYDAELITRLASPIQLNPGPTEVILTDYIDAAELAIKISGHASLSFNYEAGDSLLVISAKEALPAISVLRIESATGYVEIPVRRSAKKEVTISHKPASADVEVVQLVGDVNAWNPSNNPMSKNADGSYSTSLYLNPGLYGYQIVEDGTWMLDPANPDSMDNGIGGFNSPLLVEGPDKNMLPEIHSVAVVESGIQISQKNTTGILAFWENMQIPVQDNIVTIPSEAVNGGRSHVRIYGMNDETLSNDLLIPLQDGKPILDAAKLSRSDFHAMTMYFPMVDRFMNARTDNDFPVNNTEILPQANHLGGDLAGIIQQLQKDYFDELHINTLWLSPIVQNAEGAYGLWNKGGVRSRFSGYHGYWPTSFTQIDYHFGTKKDFNMLVKSAHARDMNVLIDFVANHVHENHPVYQQHKDWATSLYLPDGSLNTERWDDQRLTTWFDTFLPTLDLENEEVAEMLSDSAVYWLKAYDIDGYRHDATKHIPENFWRMLTAKVKEYEKQQGKTIYQVGETYGTVELIGSYLSTGMLDAQFDFNVYDALVNAICRDSESMRRIPRQINQSLNYYGSHHLMCNISGNQDKARLMSLATGEVRFDEDTKEAGWSRKINKQTKAGFNKVAMMHLMNFTIPGIPVIYYGDEIGMPGGNDPDNRRMMKFDGLSKEELKLKETVSTLARLRSNNLALIYGELSWLYEDDQRLAFVRQYFDDSVLILANNSTEDHTFKVELPKHAAGEKATSVFGNSFAISGGNVTCTVPAGGFEIIELSK